MQKIIATIITSIIVISSTFHVSASDGKIVELFDLYNGIEEYSLWLVQLEPVRFSNPNLQKTYDEFLIVDSELKNVFITKYRNRKLSYYEIQDLTIAYKNFVFYTGKTFSYIAEQEAGLVSPELDRALKNSYDNMRTSYARVFHILSR